MTMKNKKTIFTAVVLAVLLAACIVVDMTLPTYHIAVTVIKKATVYALVAVSMNLLNGFTGLFSLGQAGFMLLGAYAYGVLTIPMAKKATVYQYFDGGALKFSVPEVFAGFMGETVGTVVGMLFCLLVGGLLAALMAYLIGLPVLRLKSDYLAIATLGFAEILRAFFQWNALGPITNGSNLLKSYPTFGKATPYVVLAGLMIAVILLLINSTYGRAFKAIRDDEVAAEAMGYSTRRKIFKHLVPNVMPQLIVQMTLSLGSMILYEATLSYLNLGVRQPYAAWGTMINIISGNPDILQNHLYVWVPAGVCIVIAVLGFNFVGDGLRDALDPKARR